MPARVLEKADNLDEAVHDLIKKNLSEHQRIIFNGDGYSDGWVEEAERRGTSEYQVYGGCSFRTDNR